RAAAASAKVVFPAPGVATARKSGRSAAANRSSASDCQARSRIRVGLATVTALDMGPVAYGSVPELPDDLPDHPARSASIASMTAVEAGDRDGWLALFAPDAVVEDPIGPSPFDPEGKGHHGRDAIAAFYDS